MKFYRFNEFFLAQIRSPDRCYHSYHYHLTAIYYHHNLYITLWPIQFSTDPPQFLKIRSDNKELPNKNLTRVISTLMTRSINFEHLQLLQLLKDVKFSRTNLKTLSLAVKSCIKN
jgi:hypothetical protein